MPPEKRTTYYTKKVGTVSTSEPKPDPKKFQGPVTLSLDDGTLSSMKSELETLLAREKRIEELKTKIAAAEKNGKQEIKFATIEEVFKKYAPRTGRLAMTYDNRHDLRWKALRAFGYNVVNPGDVIHLKAPVDLLKTLSSNGSPSFGGKGLWPLPTKDAPGSWHEVQTEALICSTGLHLTTPNGALTHWRSERVFTVEVDGPVIQRGDKFCARRVRLIREIKPLAGSALTDALIQANLPKQDLAALLPEPFLALHKAGKTITDIKTVMDVQASRFDFEAREAGLFGDPGRRQTLINQANDLRTLRAKIASPVRPYNAAELVTQMAKSTGRTRKEITADLRAQATKLINESLGLPLDTKQKLPIRFSDR